MNWKLLVCMAVLYQYGLVHIAIKRIGAVEGSRTRKLVWQYFFAALLAIATAVIAGRIAINMTTLVVAVIGAANAFACYCHWRAYDISMARTAVMSNLDDLLAMALGYLLLGELRVLTPLLAAGVILCLVSAIVFAKIKQKKDGAPVRLIGWVIGYSTIWGVAIFSMRYFSLQGLSMPTYVVAWYFGAWCGALLTRFVLIGPHEAGPPLTLVQRSKVFLLAGGIWTSLMMSYWIRELLPNTVAQPIQLVAEMCIPVFTAMVFFGEARTMSRKELLVIFGGIIGVILIAIGF